MPGLIEQVALGLAPWYIKWPVKLFLGAQKAAGAVLRWAGHNPWQASVVALCALSLWLWRHDSGIIEGQRVTIAARDKTISDMKAASEQNRLAQIAAVKAKEQHYKDIAHEADKEHAEQLADANDALRKYIAAHRVRPATTSGGVSPASSAAENPDPGIPPVAPAETGLVAVTETSLHVCAADYAYALSAHDWAMKLKAKDANTPADGGDASAAQMHADAETLISEGVAVKSE